MTGALHPARAALAERLGLIVRMSADDIAGFAAAAGVSVRALRTARRGLPVAVDAHLGLCRALRLDPATGAAVRRAEKCGRVRWDHVRASLVCARAGAGLTLRAAAERIGIGAATLLRAERGETVSVEVFLKLCQWLGMPPAHLTDEAPCWRLGAVRRPGSRQW
jgi:DNA-binding XRE family transcriptional regulator